MPKIHHIENVVKLAPKARLNPLENAQKSSYRKHFKVGIISTAKVFGKAQKSSYQKYCKVGIKSKANPFGTCPTFIIWKTF